MKRADKTIIAKLPLPKSETHFGLNLLGLISGTLFVYIAYILDFGLGKRDLSILAMAATAFPIVLVELIQQYSTRKQKEQQKNPVNYNRILTKWFGQIMTFLIIYGCYSLFPEYERRFYRLFKELYVDFVPYLILIGLPYIAYVDRRMKDPEDRLYSFGRFCLFQWQDLELSTIRNHAADWVVKGFFLPLMVTYLGQNIAYIFNYDWSKMDGFVPFYDYAYNFIFFLDLLYAATGYIMTFKLLNTHIRSTDPTALGWIAALVCYSPFWTILISARYIAYNNGFYWGHWLEGMPTLKIVWGVAILTFITIYSLATVSLGIRFSNLTYRGLVTNGPYRFCKHPAYVAKCLSWWFISIPFISNGSPLETLENCLMLVILNIIYYVRARTEENHLSQYPEYVEYAVAMNQRSLFAPLTRLLPFLKYKPPGNVNIKV